MAAESRRAGRNFNDHFTCSRVPSLAYLEFADFKKPGVFAPGIFPSDIAVNNPPCAIARKISIGGAICYNVIGQSPMRQFCIGYLPPLRVGCIQCLTTQFRWWRCAAFARKLPGLLLGVKCWGIRPIKPLGVP